MKNINTSTVDFPTLIQNGFVYVDKTRQIYDLARPDTDGFDEGEVASAKPRRGSLLYKTKCAIGGALLAALGAFGAETLPNWTMTWTNDAHTAGTASNDQNAFVLRVYRSTSHNGGFGLGVGISGEKQLGAGVVSAGDPEAAAYLDMRGTITGLDYNADPATNAVWKFSYLCAYCFCPNDGNKNAVPAQWISGLRTPGTLAGDGWTGVFHVDTQPNPQRTREIIVDEPNFTGNLGGWGLNAVGGLTNLVLKCPKAVYMTDPVSHSANGWKTDISDAWDLSGVKYVGHGTATATPSWGPLSSSVNGMTGTLRLPSLIHIAAGPTDNGSAFRCGIGSAELGLDGNLVSLACHSFKDCANLTNVIIGTALGKTLTVWTNAFRCANLKTIYFNGDKPAFKYAYNASSPAFGLASTPEGQITFYVRDVPSWAKVLAEADANGGYVAGSTLHTANRQKVVRYSGFSKAFCELQDPRFAAEYHETVTLSGTPCASAGKGTWNAYTGSVSLTASCSDPDDAATDPRRSKFLRWDGVPVALERQNPVTFTPSAGTTVQAVFAHDWLMTTDDEPDRTMENGIWRICCYKRSVSDHYLGIGQSSSRVGKGQAFPAAKEDRIGGGDLNLNGDVWEPLGDGTWQKWTIVSSGSLAPWFYDNKAQGADRFVTEGEYDKLPTRVTFPESLLYYPGELYNNDAWDNGTYRFPITEVIAILPNVREGSVVAFSIGGVGQVSRLVIRAPRITQLGSGGSPYGMAWSSSTFARTNFDEWDLTGVTKVMANALRCASTFQAKGTLHLPNLQTVGTNAFRSASSFTGLVAGTNGLTLASIGDNAFQYAVGLTNLVLGTSGLTLGTNVFNCANLKTVYFPGPVLPTETVDAILSATTESAAEKSVTIYASLVNGWSNLADAATSAEAAVAPVSARYGVYRRDLRKAWLVHAPSAYDPKGTVFLFR